MYVDRDVHYTVYAFVKTDQLVLLIYAFIWIVPQLKKTLKNYLNILIILKFSEYFPFSQVGESAAIEILT